MSVPTLASNTVAGEIFINGDFVGLGDAPQLIKTGVSAGSYEIVKRISVDKKGRTTAAGATTQAELDVLIDAAYAASPSSFTLVSGRPVLNIPNASASVPGLVKLGTTVGTTPGQVTMPIATTGAPGVMTIGSGLKWVSTADPVPGSTTNITIDAAFTSPATYQDGTGGGGGFFSLVKNNGRMVIVGGGSKAAYSTDDGATWTSVTAPMTDACGVVGNGSNTLISFSRPSSATAMRSTDNGSSWSSFTMPGASTPKWRNCVWNGSLFCAVGTNSTGHLCATSPDGVTWTLRSISGTSFFPHAIVWTGTKFIVSGHDVSNIYTFYSTDGTSWTAGATIARGGGTTAALAYVNGKTIMSNDSASAGGWGTGYVQVSTDDGVSWNTRFIGSTFITSTQLWRTFSDGLYYVTFSGTDAKVYYTADGDNWLYKTITVTNTHTASPYGSQPQFWYDGTNITIIGEKTTSSFDRTVYTKAEFINPTIAQKYGLNFDQAGLMPAGGGTTTGVWNPDLAGMGTVSKTSWTPAGATEAAGLGQISFANNNQVNISLNAAPTTVADTSVAASSGSLIVRFYLDANGGWYSATTTDGVTWTTYPQTAPTGASPRVVGMASDGTNFVVIGKQAVSGTFTPWSARSTDGGQTWTYNNTPWTTGLSITSGLCWGSTFSKYMAVGRNASNQFAFIHSADGATWTSGTIATSVAGAFTGIAYSVCTGGTPMAAAITGNTGSISNYWYTTNGTTWTVVTSFSGGFVIGNNITSNDFAIYIVTTISGTIVQVSRVRSGGSPLGGGGNSGASAYSNPITGLFASDDYLWVYQDNKYWRLDWEGSGAFNDAAGVSGPGAGCHPLKLGSSWVAVDRCSNNLGGSNSTANTPATATNPSTFTGVARGPSAWNVVPPDTNSGGSTPFHDAVVGTVNRLTFTTGAAPYELKFVNVNTVPKVAGGARVFLEASSRKTITTICTSTTEVLVFEE